MTNCSTSAKYCGFINVLDNDEVVKDVCKFCKRKVIYKKVDGKIDNARYLKDHIRDFCQPQGPTKDVFLEVYGRDAYADWLRSKRHNEGKARREETRADMMKEAKRYLKRDVLGSVKKPDA